MRKRCSETRYEGKQSEDCHGFHASALLVLQISLRRSAMRRFYYVLVGRHIANAMIFSIVFEHRDRSRHRHRSIRVEKTTFDFCTEMYGAPAKKCSGPENRDASILFGRHIANAMIFSTGFDRSSTAFGRGIERLPNGWAGWLAGLAGLVDSV